MCWESTNTPTSGWASRIQRAARIALVGVRRRHPHVDDGEIGRVLADRAAQAVGVVDGGDDLVAGVLEQPPQALAQERLVLGDHDAHGSSATTAVPSPRGLETLTLPPSAATRSVMPASPERSLGDRTADAVVGDPQHEAAVGALRR